MDEQDEDNNKALICAIGGSVTILEVAILGLVSFWLFPFVLEFTAALTQPPSYIVHSLELCEDVLLFAELAYAVSMLALFILILISSRAEPNLLAIWKSFKKFLADMLASLLFLFMMFVFVAGLGFFSSRNVENGSDNKAFGYFLGLNILFYLVLVGFSVIVFLTMYGAMETRLAFLTMRPKMKFIERCQWLLKLVRT